MIELYSNIIVVRHNISQYTKILFIPVITDLLKRFIRIIYIAMCNRQRSLLDIHLFTVLVIGHNILIFNLKNKDIKNCNCRWTIS